jgi:hypothetical protein
MPETTMDARTDEKDTPLPLATRLAVGVVAVIALLGAAYGMLRVSTPPIPVGKKPPANHFTLDCGYCHSIVPAPAAGATS